MEQLYEISLLYVNRITNDSSLFMIIFKGHEGEILVSQYSLGEYFSRDQSVIGNYIADHHKRVFSDMFGQEAPLVDNLTTDSLFVTADGVRELAGHINTFEVDVLLKKIFKEPHLRNPKPDAKKISDGFKNLSTLISDSFMNNTKSRAFQIRDILRVWRHLSILGESETWLNTFLNDLMNMNLESIYSVIGKYIQQLHTHQVSFAHILEIIICIFGYIEVDRNKLQKLFLDSKLSIYKFKQPTSDPLHAMAKAQLNRSKNKGNVYTPESGILSIEEKNTIAQQVLAKQGCKTNLRDLSELNDLNYSNIIKLPHPDSLLPHNMSLETTVSMKELTALAILFMEISNRELYNFSNYIAEIDSKNETPTVSS